MASSTRIPAITMYGTYTFAANSLRIASRSAPLAAALTVPSSSPIPCSTNAPSTMGLRIPAALLQMPMMLMRRAALSIGPMMLM